MAQDERKKNGTNRMCGKMAQIERMEKMPQIE